MAQVNSENSITVPVDTTRRHLLTVATAGAIAGLIPSAAMAAAPAVDPIFAAIELHKQTAAVWDAAVGIWANFEEGPGPMALERRIERDRVNGIWSAARDALDGVAIKLINTRPTTLSGISRALNFIREQIALEDGMYMPSGLELKGSDHPEVCGWVDAFLGTIASAAGELGKAVQS